MKLELIDPKLTKIIRATNNPWLNRGYNSKHHSQFGLLVFLAISFKNYNRFKFQC